MPRNPVNWMPFLLGAFLIVIVLNIVTSEAGKPTDEVTYSQLTAQIDEKKVTKAEINENLLQVSVELKDGTKEISNFPAAAGDDLADALTESGAEVTVAAPRTPSLLTNVLITLLPVALIIAFLFLLMRKGGMGGIGGAMRMGKKTNPVEIPDTRFSDVAGVDEAVHELAEVVDFLHNPEKYLTTGAKVPRGFLLIGPPGTGKTLLARAVAGEAGVPFFSITGSDFVEMFVGLGAARVRELFEKARAMDKAIIFVDEIDAVGKARGRGIATGANDERENTLNQLLVEMDGFAKSTGVVMIAATNRPDVLDPALLRPGRFDRKIYVPPPDRGGREKLLRLYATSRPFADDIDWAALAKRLPGMTGAEIEQMLNEAALDAARKGSATITNENVQNAVATSVLGRERKSAVISDRDREIVAWHEAGHTVVALVVDDAPAPVSVTVVPRGGAGGVTWLGGSDHDFTTRNQARAQLTVAMGGRAAEEILLDGDHTQGAHGDLQSATNLANEMVSKWGMGERMVAVNPDRMSIAGYDRIENETASLIEAGLQRARDVLAEHRPLLERIATDLLDKETLTLAELHEIRADVEPGWQPPANDDENASVETVENSTTDAEPDRGPETGSDADGDAGTAVPDAAGSAASPAHP